MSPSLASAPTDDSWMECANGRIKIYIDAHNITMIDKETLLQTLYHRGKTQNLLVLVVSKLT